MSPGANETRLTLLSRVRDPSDTAAWREFEDMYREMLVRFCLSQAVQHADAEDAVQQVFTNLSRTLPGFVYDPQRGRFRDYLFRATRNAITALRSRKRPITGLMPLSQDESRVGWEPDTGDQPSPAESAAWEKEWVAHHYRRALTKVRAQFEPRSVEVFERNVAGVSVALLAQEFGMTEEAVYKVRQRVRARMQELIEEQVRDEDRVDP
ncbi:MAG: sigma-70 family RNA polymerase sigma factor [Phycisphaerales bacterium]